jgi:predicted secreted protein
MKWTSILAIYLLFWVMTAFFVLPIGIRTAEEAGAELVPGQSHSAPAEFHPLRIVLRTTVAATLFFGLYYLNYVNGWITADRVIGLFPQV